MPGTGWFRLGVGLIALLLTLLLFTPTPASALADAPLPCAVEKPADLDGQAPWSNASPVVSPVDDYAQRPANPFTDLAVPGREVDLPVPSVRYLAPHGWHAGGAPHDIRHGFVATAPPA